MFYENHVHEDPRFPIILHKYSTRLVTEEYSVNWHESIEILYFIDGYAKIISDTQYIMAQSGDIVVINSNHLHEILSLSESCCYHCLIPDKVLCEECNIPVLKLNFTPVIKDKSLCDLMDQIIEESESAQPYYQAAIKAKVISLLVNLTRFYTQETNENGVDGIHNQKITMVKQAISMMSENYKNNISTQDICKKIGFSKYYFCHNFKEVTGQTVLEYLNFIRCNNARQLLSTGKYTVNECAEQSGFQNASYFSKTYKKIFNISPSADLGVSR